MLGVSPNDCFRRLNKVNRALSIQRNPEKFYVLYQSFLDEQKFDVYEAGFFA